MKNIESIHQEAIEITIDSKKKYDLVSFFRIVLFVVSLIEIVRYFIKSNTFELIIGVVSFALFLFLLSISVNLSNTIQFYNNVKSVCDEIKNQGKKNLKNTVVESVNDHHYAFDLDVIGNKSLIEKINRCQTNIGKNKLKFFLLNHLLDPNAIIERQNAVKELSGKLEWCVKFLANTKSIQSKVGDFKKQDKWTFNYTDFRLNSKTVQFLLIAIPILNVILIVLAFTIKSTLISSLVFFVLLLISMIINKLYGKSINEIVATVDNKANELKGYVAVFTLIEQEQFNSKEEILLQQKIISKNNEAASVLIKKLSGLIDSFESGNIMIFGTIFNVVFLWKLQFAVRIEKFIFDNSNELPQWFDAVAEYEALICFGLFAYQNEGFNYPICTENVRVVTAVNLSHPLISKNARVYNNFSTIQNNNVTIITGANMTGKSTFLRSIGINLVLAMNGCPVCAESFSFYPISIFTSMRTSDSLSDGSSYFNAEIKRLKILVDKLENKEPQFIILDEILKGTNSVDKLKGSELFLEKIMKMQTFNTCLIATHDLDLTKMEDLYPNTIVNYCFELYNNNGLLEPDYKLQRGVTKSMNAIDLMRRNKIID
ncbi:MutS-related protein [Flavobacterium cellulosilyticum]|uniref:DNA mismatch repair protein MutS n=1 Tax=Flavobacterium cellulosilyticum TaxID=2541731 RepID=A0A4R5CHE2_9FLAO|nr:DNA mismatch repair protein MutS [Flavobacterium cellulosilyticum]TDD98466.1 DNA mismatch repair protein MutS [Flavobacterium cellulosilyticum]